MGVESSRTCANHCHIDFHFALLSRRLFSSAADRVMAFDGGSHPIALERITRTVKLALKLGNDERYSVRLKSWTTDRIGGITVTA